MPIYAQIDSDQIAIAVTQTHAPLIGAQYIQLDSLDQSVLGKRWTGTSWADVEQAPVRIITKLEFRSRFSDDEKRAIYAARAINLDVDIWLDDLASAAEIQLDDPRTIAGVHALESAGLIGTGRATEILL
jgi:hypothetical protein